MRRGINAFLADETGATAIEYALIATLISVAIIGAAMALGIDLAATFKKVSDAIRDAIT